MRLRTQKQDGDAGQRGEVLAQDLDVLDDRPGDDQYQDDGRTDSHGLVHAIGEGGAPPPDEQASAMATALRMMCNPREVSGGEAEPEAQHDQTECDG